MRVLVFTNFFPPDYVGGAEVSIYHSCRGLMTRGVVCSVLTVNHRQPVRANEWFDLDGLSIHRVRFDTRLPGGSLFDPRVYQTVRREIADLRPDVVHVHNVSGASLAPFAAAKSMGVPVLNTLHDLWLICPCNMRLQADGSYCDPRRWPNGCGRCWRQNDYWAAVPRRHQIFAALTRGVDRFLSPSQAVIDRLVETGYDRERFQLLRLGFDDAARQNEPLPAPVARAIGETRGRPIIVFAGGGTTIKGARVVLDAVPKLVEQVKGLRVLVAGGGDPEVLAEFERLPPPASEQVTVLGRVPFHAMRQLFAAADLTLFPSLWHENSPVTIFENFQVGTPLVASRVGGIPEFIDEGETGYLVPPGDVDALVDAVVGHFGRSPVERRRMRQRCVKVVQTGLSLDAHLDALEKVYEEMLGRGTTRKNTDFSDPRSSA